MLDFFDFARDMSFIGISARLCLAVLCGGLIGIEREYKRRPAGFRTHILICLGAALTTLTSQYLFLERQLFTDMARLGAQVIAGIGFIGAGTIIVTRKQRVKGLTTAAGLWTAAIIGLVCGAGYIELALFATLMVLFAELILIRIEYKFARKASDSNLYIEYAHAVCIQDILRICREKAVKVDGLEITRINIEDGSHKYHAVITVHTPNNKRLKELLGLMTALDGILSIEEL